MKILFDTNVLISAFLAFKKGSVCYDIIDHAVEVHNLYYTAFIIDEFKRVFKEDFHYPERLIDEFVAFITKFFTEGDTADTVEKISRDPKDNQVLADAVTNEIDVIITGDKDLLELKNYKGIKIITPRDYWKL
ncbi:MAG: putative toxin-antitoxin system toxin component, PIN family [Nitrospirae bacterium CG02_land_8_20_14_3_00_41_53]|nr:MAG: putative toxin-antitoxin system toxin component, PIN family [Nitrospirae bacterium CG02_land_8_20_14_3_00_41_53]PJC46496.1 MAG: putative toxin-antitoxin system toxin component, PIN family [Candidatus Omnitrophica bacterium CG_4_9_14_0_2_um_filter_43_12]